MKLGDFYYTLEEVLNDLSNEYKMVIPSRTVAELWHVVDYTRDKNTIMLSKPRAKKDGTIVWKVRNFPKDHIVFVVIPHKG